MTKAEYIFEKLAGAQAETYKAVKPFINDFLNLRNYREYKNLMKNSKKAQTVMGEESPQAMRMLEGMGHSLTKRQVMDSMTALNQAAKKDKRPKGFFKKLFSPLDKL